MMEFWTAFVLGLAGSLHCAGMCGPLVLALPVDAPTVAGQFVRRVVYNAGRICTYGLLGVAFGFVGKVFSLVGLQRWVSLGAGLALLLGLLLGPRLGVRFGVTPPVSWLKSALGRLLRQRTFASLFAFGALNGLLPCGLVYVACAGAVAVGNMTGGIAYMLVFGLGTVPMLVAIGMSGGLLQAGLRNKLGVLVPLSVGLMAILLVLRGLSIGVPYISPDVSQKFGTGQCCHPRPPQAP